MVLKTHLHPYFCFQSIHFLAITDVRVYLFYDQKPKIFQTCLGSTSKNSIFFYFENKKFEFLAEDGDLRSDWHFFICSLIYAMKKLLFVKLPGSNIHYLEGIVEGFVQIHLWVDILLLHTMCFQDTI